MNNQKRELRLILAVLSLFFFAQTNLSVLYAQSIKGSWTNIAKMPTARWFPGTCAYDGKIYVIGGNSDANSAPLNVVEVYNPTSDSWEAKSPIPAARSQLSACEVDGKIYVIGGSSGPTGWIPVAGVYIYNPANDTWSQGADMPNPRAELALVAVGGKIYAIGGIDGTSTGSKSVDIYDPVSNTWSKGKDMPTARGTMPAVEMNGKIYVFGGSNGNVSGWNHCMTLEVYDIADDSWETKAGMPFSRSHLTGCKLNNKIYALGGSQVGNGISYAEVASYNPVLDDWSFEPSMITAREAFTATVVDDKIYAIGGTQIQKGLVAFSDAEVYDTIARVFISDSEIRLPKKESALIGKLYVPNSGTLKFTYELSEGMYDDSLFVVQNDSVFAAADFNLNAGKEYTIDVLAVSENDDTVHSQIKLTTYFKVEAVFTGPSGFTLTSSDKRVMIDAFSSKSPCYSFISNSDTIYESMKAGADPFNHADIIYTSHSHCCHFDASLLYNALNNNPTAIAVMNDDVRQAMNSYFTAHPELLNRVYVPKLSVNQYIDTTIAGVDLRLTKISHEGSTTLCINVMLDSIRFTNFDDYNDLTLSTYQTIGFGKLPTDVAFLGSQLLNHQDVLTSVYNPGGLLTFSHINAYSSSLNSSMLTKTGALNDLGYQTDILVWPMEMFSYTKKNGSLIREKLNNAPALNKTFDVVNAEVNTEVIVNIPKSSFKDQDAGDVLSYSFLISGQPLSACEWAIFDNAKSRLVMTPVKAKNYTITVIATDNHLSFSNTSFALKVAKSTDIEENESGSDFSIYPNPTQSLITIGSTKQIHGTYSVRIYNLLGEILYMKNETGEKELSIDLSGFPKSVMYLILTYDGKTECHKIVRN